MYAVADGTSKSDLLLAGTLPGGPPLQLGMVKLLARKRGCATRMEFMLDFLGLRGAAVHCITAVS